MKKIVSLVCIAVCLSMAMPVGAQLNFGLKGGLNLASAPSLKYGGVDDAVTATKGATGFFIGPMAEFTVPIIGIGLDGALLYAQKGSKVENETLTKQGIEIPINLKYSVGLGSLASVFVAAGPDIFFNLKKEAFKEDLEGFKSDYSAAELGLNVGIGVKVLAHLQAGVNYSIPLSSTKIISETGTTEDFTFKSNIWQISLAYIF